MRTSCALTILLLLGFAACSDEGSTITIESIQPAQCTVRGGAAVRITGTGFGDSPRVFFGEVEATVTSSAATEIRVVAPPRALGGPVDVTVESDGMSTVLPDGFTYVGIQLRFVDRSETHLIPGGPMQARFCRLADLDGDGSLDLVAGVLDGVQLFVNGGDGTMTAGDVTVDSPVTDYVHQALPGDFNGDGRQDLFLLTQRYVPNRLLINQGNLMFRDATSVPEGETHSHNGRVADLDGDGDLDLVIVNQHWADPETPTHVQILINSMARLDDEAAERLPEPEMDVYGVAVGDVDGDGDPDLFFSSGNYAQRLFLNDGLGHFREAPPEALPNQEGLGARLPELADLDGDGHLDIYLPSTGQDRIYLNDGTGRFAEFTELLLGPEDDYTVSATLTDLDLDGDVDVVLANWNGPLRILRNDGTGRLFDYSSTIVPAGPADLDSLSVPAGDLDGDGDVDLFVCRDLLRRPLLLVNWDPLPTTDRDDDGVPDPADNCPDDPNPDQANRDRVHFTCLDGPDCEAVTGCELVVRRDVKAYLLCRDPALGWSAARAHCQSFGADLAVIETGAENAWLAEQNLDRAWIGLSDTETEGTWLWIDGGTISYEAWNEGEPNDSGGVEDCGAIYVSLGDPAGIWNDLNCETEIAFICEDVINRAQADPGDACEAE